MKRYFFLLFLILFSTGFLSSCDEKITSEISSKGDSKIVSYYTCSMHPRVRENKPGRCPICGMELIKVEKESFNLNKNREIRKTDLYVCRDYPDLTSDKPGECPIDGTPMVKMSGEEKEGNIVAKVALRKVQVEHFKAAVFKAQRMRMKKNVRLLGTLIQTEEKESFVPARISGRVEKVFIKSEGQFVRQGQKVLELYSPQIISSGDEYIVAVKNLKDTNSSQTTKETFKSLAKQAREKLKLWGITDNQLKSWLEAGSVPEKVAIYSPVTGIILKRFAKEGSYFKEGQNFFKVVDLSVLWVELDVYEHEAGIIELGQKIELSSPSYKGEQWSTQVDFINPILNKETRTLRVRATIENREGKLKPGMIVDASLEIILSGLPLVVPRTAIIDTGKRKVIWIEAGKHKYYAKTVRTGFESQGYVEIKEGLLEGDRVVAEGNFLLDAQAQLFGGYEAGEIQENNSNKGHIH